MNEVKFGPYKWPNKKCVLGGYNGPEMHIVPSPFVTGLGPTLHLQSDDVWWFRWFGSTTPKIDGNLMSYDFTKDCTGISGFAINVPLLGGWVWQPHHDRTFQKIDG